jgi:hypothetical protein
MARTDARAAPREGEPPRHVQLPAKVTEPRSSAFTVARGVAAGLDAALRYAEAGWSVFPCKPGLKEPATPHGFKDATTDLGQIRRWWTRRLAFNVAAPTGAPGPDVLDVDVHPGGSGFEAFNRLTRAGLLTGAKAIIRTPSGGLHVYFDGTDQANGRLPRHHLDFRGLGGYVLAPPSVVDGNPYELVDKRAAAGRLDWRQVRELLDPPHPVARRPTGGDIGHLAKWVAGLAEGNRNDGLFWAACRAVEAGAADLSVLAAAAVLAGLSEREAWQTITSAERRVAS